MTTPFTDDEVEKLRDLISVAETVKSEAEYRAAVRIVLRVWKNLIIGLAAIVGAIVLLREHLVKFWQALVGG